MLQKMKDLYEEGIIKVRPNIHCYTSVINSCAYCARDDAEKKDALTIALGTYKAMEASQDVSPNHITYATMITALRNLLPHSTQRTEAVVSVFKQCCKNGQVDELVLHRLSSTLKTKELKQLFSNSAVSAKGRIDICQLPDKWSSNVVEK